MAEGKPGIARIRPQDGARIARSVSTKEAAVSYRKRTRPSLNRPPPMTAARTASHFASGCAEPGRRTLRLWARLRGKDSTAGGPSRRLIPASVEEGPWTPASDVGYARNSETISGFAAHGPERSSANRGGSTSSRARSKRVLASPSGGSPSPL